jgi:hypothetical protein
VAVAFAVAQAGVQPNLPVVQACLKSRTLSADAPCRPEADRPDCSSRRTDVQYSRLERSHS